MNIEDWKSQIKRGTLEFCILLMIKQKPTYGYMKLSVHQKNIQFWQQGKIQYIHYLDAYKRGIYYIFMARRCEGLPPRKYYSITNKGLEYIAMMSQEWNNLLETVALLLQGAQ